MIRLLPLLAQWLKTLNVFLRGVRTHRVPPSVRHCKCPIFLNKGQHQQAKTWRHDDLEHYRSNSSIRLLSAICVFYSARYCSGLSVSFVKLHIDSIFLSRHIKDFKTVFATSLPDAQHESGLLGERAVMLACGIRYGT